MRKTGQSIIESVRKVTSFLTSYSQKYRYSKHTVALLIPSTSTLTFISVDSLISEHYIGLTPVYTENLDCMCTYMCVTPT